METFNGIGTCGVCTENKINSVYLCGHAYCCLDCARRIGSRCPCCRNDCDFIELFNVSTDIDIPEVIQTLETKIKESLETLQLQELNFREKMENFKTEMEDFKTKKEEEMRDYEVKIKELTEKTIILQSKLEESEHIITQISLKKEVKPTGRAFMMVSKSIVESMKRDNEKYIKTRCSDDAEVMEKIINRVCNSGSYYTMTPSVAINFTE